MAQAGKLPLINYNSGTASNVPVAGNLVFGEFALNYKDGLLYYKDDAGVVQILASKTATQNATGSSTFATLTGAQTLTNKTLSGASNTFTNIPNTALTNSSLTVGTTNIALGATVTSLAGLTGITLTQDPTGSLGVATKQMIDSLKTYVDTNLQGLDSKASVRAATTANITLSGTQTINSVVLVAGDRVLVKSQTAPAENGIYTVSASTWVRATDYDAWTEFPGSHIFIESGDTVLGNTAWVFNGVATGTVGTTAITFGQFQGVGTYTQGTGITLSNNQFSISNTGITAGTYGGANKFLSAQVNAQGQIVAISEVTLTIDGGTF